MLCVAIMLYRVVMVLFAHCVIPLPSPPLSTITQRVLKKFKGDLKLWLQYIEFAQHSRHKLSLSRIYGRALAIHPGAISKLGYMDLLPTYIRILTRVL